MHNWRTVSKVEEGISMTANMSVSPHIMSSAAAELETLTGLYSTLLNTSEQTVARAPLINLGQQAIALEMAHARFLQASISQQKLLVQTREMLQETSHHYTAQEQSNVQMMSATMPTR